MSATLFTARSLRIAVGTRVLIEDLGLDVAAGQGVAVTGPSGSGKSTLLRALAALDAVTGGEIRLRGRTPAEIGFPAYRRAVHHEPATPAFVGTTVEDALRRVTTFACADRAYDREQTDRLLHRLGLPADVLTRDPATLSTGERQRLAIARTGLVTPEVLLLDEPTSALDDDATRLVEDLLREAMRRGAGIVCVTHDVEQAARLGLTPLRISVRETAVA